MRNLKKIILTTGGTGGHIYPALAVAEGLKLKNIDVLFVGTSIRMEKDIVPEAGFRFIGLDIKPPKNIKSILKYIKGVWQGIKIVAKEKPDAIIGGILLRKKVYLQEQNANLGWTNKVLYKFAEKTFLAFDKTYDDIPLKYQKRFDVTGNPLREEINYVNENEERERLKLEEDEKVILITGGSLGAKDINEAVIKNWNKFLEDKKLRVYWATGENNFEEIGKRILKTKMSDTVKPYFNNIINIMAAADLIICRAGALTISEIIELEKPSIIIPYNSLKVGQYDNAKILEENNSALVYTNTEADSAIEKALELIKNEEALKSMRVRIRSLKKSNAVEKIINDLDIWRN